MKQESIQVEGVIDDILPNTIFAVKVEGLPKIVYCHISGKIRKNNIRIITGDKVLIEISPYDLTRGRVIYRNKESSYGKDR